MLPPRSARQHGNVVLHGKQFRAQGHLQGQRVSAVWPPTWSPLWHTRVAALNHTGRLRGAGGVFRVNLRTHLKLTAILLTGYMCVRLTVSDVAGAIEGGSWDFGCRAGGQGGHTRGHRFSTVSQQISGVTFSYDIPAPVRPSARPPRHLQLPGIHGPVSTVNGHTDDVTEGKPVLIPELKSPLDHMVPQRLC